MKKTNIKLITRQVVYAIVGVTTMLAYFPSVASAAQITARSVELGSSLASASTTYSFSFTLPSTATNIKSVEIKACQEASGACTAATGFSASSATMTGQPTNMGDATGWTETSTATALRIANATNSTNPSGSASVVNFASVVNPSTVGTFYLQITTFTSSDWTTGATDTGTIAASTAASVTVTANVNETLTFTVTDTAVALTPTLGSGTTGVGTSTMSAGTNASSGYTISYTGTTLTSGANTINAITTNGTGSTAGTEQFGLNLMNNTTPNVGVDPTGGTGTASANYNTADDFKFVSGETVAEAAAATDATAYTVSYIANITDSQAPGAYTANINYVATANF
jgi:hypothetical protein